MQEHCRLRLEQRTSSSQPDRQLERRGNEWHAITMSERNGTYQEVPDVDGGMSAPYSAFHKWSIARSRVF
jgi:hypothetical protein